MILANQVFITHRKTFKIYKFKVSTPTWNDEFDLADGSYFILDIQDHV